MKNSNLYNLIFKICFITGMFSLLIGCIPKYYLKHPDFENRRKKIKKLALQKPDIKIYKYTAEGSRKQRDDWSKLGQNSVFQSVKKNLEKKKYSIKRIELDDDLKADMEDVLALYRAVDLSIKMHVLGPHKFPEKKKKFDYSIGPIHKILDKIGADVMVLIYGIDEHSTVGRDAFATLGVISGFFSGSYMLLRADKTSISIAVIDREGTILWYGKNNKDFSFDLRKNDSTDKVICDILYDLPGAIK